MIIRYGLLSGVGVVVDVLIFKALIGVELNYILANIIAFIFSFTINFLLTVKFVFSYQFSKKTDFLNKFSQTLIVSLMGLGLSTMLLILMHEWLQFTLLISKITSVIIVFMWNYSLRKYFIFRKAV
jgi:putative flippase GtrA